MLVEGPLEGFYTFKMNGKSYYGHLRIGTMGTWYGRSSSYGEARAEREAHRAHLAHGLSGVSYISNLDIYRSLIAFL